MIHVKFEFRYFIWESYWVGVYTPKESRIGDCIFSLTDYIQSHFLLTLGHQDIFYIFFDILQYRSSVFYKTERIELAYILQNRVEKGIVYFLWQIILRAILFLTLGFLDYIYIFSIRVKFEFWCLTWESILSWCIYSKTE